MAKVNIEIKADTPNKVVKCLKFLIKAILLGAKKRDVVCGSTSMKLDIEGEYAE